MSRDFLLAGLILTFGSHFTFAQTDKAPSSKIKPGEVIVPVGKGEQRLFFGEILSLDLKNRCGTLRYEHNDMVTPFNVLPYAELSRNAAKGDLQDFRIGERALFRLHQDKDGKWTWLTYIGDEVSFLKNHSSVLWVDALDPAKGLITISRGNAAKSEWGEKGAELITDADTRYWKAGKPAAFKDIKVGDRLLTNTHGVGKGKTRVCWEVFLDDESFKQSQEEQRAVHAKRRDTEGLIGYVDARDGKTMRLTLFNETPAFYKDLKTGQKVRLATAGVDRKPTAEPVTGTFTGIQQIRRLCKVALTLDTVTESLAPPGLVRVWLVR